MDPDPAATTLTISFSATSTTNVDLYVKAVTVGEPERSWRQLFVNRGTSQWDPAADADFSSEASGGSEQIEITASSVPPLAEVYWERSRNVCRPLIPRHLGCGVAYYPSGLLRLPINSSKSSAWTKACCAKFCFEAMLTTRGGPFCPWRG